MRLVIINEYANGKRSTSNKLDQAAVVDFRGTCHRPAGIKFDDNGPFYHFTGVLPLALCSHCLCFGSCCGGRSRSSAPSECSGASRSSLIFPGPPGSDFGPRVDFGK